MPPDPSTKRLGVKYIFELGPSPSLLAAKWRCTPSEAKLRIDSDPLLRETYAGRVREVAEALKIFGVDMPSLAIYLGVELPVVKAYISENPSLKRAYDGARVSLFHLAERGLIEALHKRQRWAIELVLLNSEMGANEGYGSQVRVNPEEEAARLGIDYSSVLDRLAAALTDVGPSLLTVDESEIEE